MMLGAMTSDIRGPARLSSSPVGGGIPRRRRDPVRAVDSAGIRGLVWVAMHRRGTKTGLYRPVREATFSDVAESALSKRLDYRLAVRSR
jgi:hypothetical protein